MAGFDPSILNNGKSFLDYQRLQADFELKKQLLAQKLQQAARGGDLPAPIQIANEIAKRRAAGDTEGANLLALSAKIYDKGLQVDPNTGDITQIGGYAPAIAGIEGAKSGAKQNAQNASDLDFKPLITAANKTAENEADQVKELQKKATTAQSAVSEVQRARQILRGNPDANGQPTTAQPTGSTPGAVIAATKKFFGQSDAETQANNSLDVIAGTLTSSIPRMEGPQSDRDVQLYREQAGNVADRTLPIGDRLAALDEIERLNQKYANIQTPAKQALSQQMEGPPSKSGVLTVRVAPTPEQAAALLKRRAAARVQ